MFAGNIEVVETLVGMDSYVNARSKTGNTPLHGAKKKEIWDILVNSGADVNLTNNKNEVPKLP